MSSLIIDTHSHLYARQFAKDQDAVIQRAQEVLEAVCLPNIDLDSIEPMHQLTAKAPDFFFPAMGLHPCSVKDGYEAVLERMKVLLDERPYVAIGETGLDLYWDKTWFEQQQVALSVQVDWAKERGLPIILHCRNALDEVIELISAKHDARLKGVFHCFDGSLKQAQRIAELGTFKLGIGGIVTYRKDVQEVVKALGTDLLVLETDSPYLPPEPHRKDKPRRNESSYTRYVAQKVAELHGITYEEVARITNAQAKDLFDLTA